MPCPLGNMLLTANGGGEITGLYTNRHVCYATMQHKRKLDDAVFLTARQQLQEYFAGTRYVFDLPLKPQGTEFQQQVWEKLLLVPYGLTQSYQQVANYMSKPKAYRAVGLANSQNPISIIIPCHRVIAKSGDLSGYAGGIDIKKWLLSHESSHNPNFRH